MNQGEPRQLERGGDKLAPLMVLFAVAMAVPGALGANFYLGVTNAVPWPGGIVPYQFDTNVTPAQQAVYLAGMREWELAANVHFVPRTNQSQYAILRLDYQQGTNTYVATTPAVLTVDTLSRAQVGHETGHLLGFQHEHVRTNRDGFITVNFSNLQTNSVGEQDPNITGLYLIDTNSAANGAYDFESVMHYGRTLFSIDPATLDVLVPKPAYYLKYYYRIGNLALSVGDRAGAAFLYGPPTTPATNIVTTTADVGQGSLRAAIYYANDHPGAAIRCNIPTNDPGYSNGVFTIYLTGELPPLVADGTTIDATTQPGFVSRPVVAVDGSRLIPEIAYTNQLFVSGLHVFSANCVLRGLAFNRFPGSGLYIEYAFAATNHVEGCFLGVALDGTNAAGSTYEGISVDTGAHNNVIGGTNTAQRNVIGGNGQYGIIIINTNTTANVVLGNYIGLNASGAGAVANGYSGIGIWGGANSNVVGGAVAGAGNVLSGNASYGLLVSDAKTVGTVIQGNYVGLDAGGSYAVPNIGGGVVVANGAHHVTVGGTNAAARNVLSGNGFEGLSLGDGGGTNVVQGNYAGLSAAGTAAVSNGWVGVYVLGGSSGNLIGGTVPGAANVLSGNFSEGLYIADPGTSNNLVQGNFIGTGPQGTNAIPNGYTGIGIWNGAANNLIGGTNPAARNFVSGNAGQGIAMGDAGTAGNQIVGNYIGVASNGMAALANGGIGIYLVNGPQNNSIGGTNIGAANVVSGNGGDGIQLYGVGTSGNLVQGNLVGTDKTGTLPLGNGSSALSVVGGAAFNLIGGTTAAARNLFTASSNYDGIYLSAASNNVIQGNYIGTDITGSLAFSNGAEGLTLFGASAGNQIGGTAAGAGNVIAASRYRGIFIADPGTSGNFVQGNYIGIGANGSTALGNGFQGVVIQNSAHNNVIGLDVMGAGAGNLIANNGLEGIVLYDGPTVGNTIRGNTFANNVRLGINLVGGTEDGFGVTANHPGGPVSGPNNLQNYPMIAAAYEYPNATRISGSLNSAAGHAYLIDLYWNAAADPSGHGEGQRYQGSTTLGADGAGNGTFVLGIATNPPGGSFTATATDASTGDTSEFAANVPATNGPPLWVGPFMRGPGGFSGSLWLQTNVSYRVQAATNLGTNPVAWVTLTNVAPSASPWQFLDSAASNFPLRFYHVVTP